MKITMTTLFWVGEPDNDENDYITNICSYWDKDWEKNYGGLTTQNIARAISRLGSRQGKTLFM